MSDITLITGSTLGGAEYVADHIAEKLEEAGISSEILHGPELHEVSLEGKWLLVCSTHGAGELPDNLQPFLEQLAEQQPDLSQVSFGAVGLGNSEYDIFCGAIQTLDQQLTALGAKRIGDCLEIDVIQHDIPEDPAGIWALNWINLLK